ncbi:serine-tRNA ligase [Allomyces macrogynus ATCC 38327]|uniref:serine--tRNA ligase n=1 Tax=Allomyces macrogynus (strain ATCC 38327) TaxID=578462 RepID=A0A0L0SJ50_ALLM3|nr:serine-tRNA ligase [Allomyces macrogynus ATCC 38327]|eukprot:KNE62410.1 serine-tRNA ligase [Allomyces macrogynus ATCC 38327]
MIRQRLPALAARRAATISLNCGVARRSITAPNHDQQPVPVQPAAIPIPNTATALPTRPFLDFKRVSANADAVQQNIADRNLPDVSAHKVAELYKLWGKAKFDLQNVRHRQNALAAENKAVRKQADAESRIEALRKEGAALKQSSKALAVEVAELEAALYAEAVHVPNDTHPGVPVGPEDCAVEIARLGPNLDDLPLRKLDPSAKPLDHVALATHLDLIDLPAGAKVAGSSFYFLKRAAALLELALTQLAVRTAVQHGFVPVSPPDIVRRSVSAACGFQPRDPRQTQNYTVLHHLVAPPVTSETNGPLTPDPNDLVLAATAEVPLAGMYAGATIPRAALPLKMVAFGHAFRAESGARGADTRGLYRVHQFSKVELFALAADAEQADAVYDVLAAVQRDMIRQLGLAVRVLQMPTQELGASARRKIDMEAWMPGRGGWGEVSSMSDCGDYQARRLGIRVTKAVGEGDDVPTPFAHTLNGTAAAVPRLIVAILEQNQLPDGSVVVPEVLRPWVGTDVIRCPFDEPAARAGRESS